MLLGPVFLTEYVLMQRTVQEGLLKRRTRMTRKTQTFLLMATSQVVTSHTAATIADEDWADKHWDKGMPFCQAIAHAGRPPINEETS